MHDNRVQLGYGYYGISMLNFGLGEIIVIVAVALIFVGPERLPEMFRFMGRMYGKIQAATYEIRREFTLEVDKVVAEERTRILRERREEMRKRVEEERLQKAQQSQTGNSENTELQGETEEPEGEYVPFDADVPVTTAPEKSNVPPQS